MYKHMYIHVYVYSAHTYVVVSACVYMDAEAFLTCGKQQRACSAEAVTEYAGRSSTSAERSQMDWPRARIDSPQGSKYPYSKGAGLFNLGLYPWVWGLQGLLARRPFGG